MDGYDVSVRPAEAPPEHVDDYEAPRIEVVLTPEELSREIQYAGVSVTTV